MAICARYAGRMKTAEPFAERNIAQMNTEKAAQSVAKEPHILLIYRKMIPSVRLCGHCQMEHLAQEGRLEYRAVQEMKLKNADLNWADVVLLGRLDSWYEKKLTEMLHSVGKYLVYIIDDDLLNVPPQVSSAAYYHQVSILKNIRSMLETSDAILSPSPLLLQKYATHGQKVIQIEEPAIAPVAYRPHDPDKPVKIGFAGSIDRTPDLEHILKDVLVQIKRAFGQRVKFEFFGAIPSFAKDIDARCIPYCSSYDAYRTMLNSLEWDIGLAPMPDTPFHACKHYNKFVEYAAAGVVGMYSDVMPYSRLQSLGQNLALLVGPEQDNWFRMLYALIDDRAELERRRQLVIQYATKEMSVAVTAEALIEQLHTLPPGHPTKKNFFCMMTMAKVSAVFDRGCHVIHGRIARWIAKRKRGNPA